MTRAIQSVMHVTPDMTSATTDISSVTLDVISATLNVMYLITNVTHATANVMHQVANMKDYLSVSLIAASPFKCAGFFAKYILRYSLIRMPRLTNPVVG